MIGLIYLAWVPLGPEPVREFLRSYGAHGAGAGHELVVVLNGGVPGGPNAGGTEKSTGEHADPAAGSRARMALLAELRETEHRLVELEAPVLDLPAYGLAARQLEHERLCLLNSYSTILADGWLGSCSHGRSRRRGSGWSAPPAAGRARRSGSAAGPCTGPTSSPACPARGATTRAFPTRTSAPPRSCSSAQLLLEMGLERAADKRATYLLESGPHSVTRQVQAHGLRAVVAGRDGRAYDVEEWPRSATYRAGGQENLLVADNRTGDWERASPRLRRRLSRDAWGQAPRAGRRES